eukprot:m.30010 g.30010  ORF g.30010 m.30010 type:complete len:138 (+) comp11999_c0_seq2:236-649(+)
MSSAVAFGVIAAGLGFGGRYAVRAFQRMPKMNVSMPKLKFLPKMDSLNAYYKGGFEEQMTKREAGLILGCRYATLCHYALIDVHNSLFLTPNSPLKRVQDAHKRMMIANHSDRGGSPYLAAKINEAKTFLDKFHPNA